jgi:hypothetical protein
MAHIFVCCKTRFINKLLLLADNTMEPSERPKTRLFPNNALCCKTRFRVFHLAGISPNFLNTDTNKLLWLAYNTTEPSERPKTRLSPNNAFNAPGSLYF